MRRPREEAFAVDDLVAEVGVDFADAAGGGQLADAGARRRHVDLAGVHVHVDVAEGSFEVDFTEVGLHVEVGAGRNFDGHVELGAVACAPAGGVRAEAAPDHHLVALRHHFRGDVVDHALVLLAPAVAVVAAADRAAHGHRVVRTVADVELAGGDVDDDPPQSVQRRFRLEGMGDLLVGQRGRGQRADGHRKHERESSHDHLPPDTEQERTRYLYLRERSARGKVIGQASGLGRAASGTARTRMKHEG